MLAAVGCFSLMDAAMKQLVSSYPAMQVSFIRGISSLPFVLLIALLMGKWHELKANRWSLHIARGVLTVFMLWAFVFSLTELSLGDAYSIFLCAPLIITAMSWAVLHEAVEWRRWVAIVVGLAGVMLILRPTGTDLVTWAGIAALSATIAYAGNALIIRILSRTDTATATVFWSLAMTSMFAGVLAIPGWRDVQWQHWPWILLIAITGTAGQVLITYAFRRAAPSVVAPFEYTALLWGVGLDWLLWSTLPNSRMYIGASIVTASGLYLIWREARQPKAVESTPVSGDILPVADKRDVSRA